MVPVILDLIVVAALVLFAFLGWRKGMVLSLCGLLAIFIAFVGASYLSQQFGDTVSGIIQPAIQVRIEQVLDESLQTGTSDPGDSVPTYTPAVPGSTATPEAPSTSLSLEEVLETLGHSTLFAGLQQAVTDAVQDGAIQVVTTASAAVAAYLAGQIARIGLFFVSFFLILLLWWLISHTLDLACRLPVLRTLNGAGGLVIGALKGVLILWVVSWLLSMMDIVPQETAAQTYLFRHFMNFQIL